MKNRLYKLAYYCYKLGFIGGIRVLFTIFFNTKNKIVSFRIPELSHPIYIRAKSSDEYAFRQIFLAKEYEFEYKDNPKTIIDAGSNIGLAAVYFANRFPDAKIICLEPEHSNIEILRLNIKPYPNVNVIQAGLWGKTSYLRIRDLGLGNWGFIVEESSQDDPESIKAVSLPDLMKEYQLETVDIVKMDIEGSEKEVLEAENCRNWLSKCNVLVIELHDRMKAGTSSALFRVLLEVDNVQVELKGENLICTMQSNSKN